MKQALMVGAIICCVIGVFFIFITIQGIIEFSSEIFRKPRDFFIPLLISVAYTLLTFTPVFILIRSKQTQMSRLRFTLTGFTELIVIGLFLAMMFPAL
jgi:cytochrome bd-type quinol oxidase subunit 2